MTRTVFESLAWLHAPADDPAACALVEAPDDWRFRVTTTATSVVWGRMPARRQRLRGAVRSALAREEILLALRGGRFGLRHWDTERIPPIGRRAAWQMPLRSVLMSGAIVRLGAGSARQRVADSIAGHAGHKGRRARLAVSGDGSVRARITRPDEPPAVLRLATVGGLKDAARNSYALRVLGESGAAHVPRLVGAGTLLEVGWSVEQELPGAPVQALSPGLLGEVAAWAATLPRTGGPALSVGERLGRIGAAFPALAADLRPAQERARAVAAAIPAVLEHGDLWAGNLLAADGRLTGVVDWDNWHPAGVPGADLLHVIAMTRRAETRQELGELWLERPWAGARFRDATADYWDRLGLELTDELAWLVGVSWWAAHVTAGLRRGRQPASDPAWVARNVENVAPRLAAIS
jgi:hypothetical protein